MIMSLGNRDRIVRLHFYKAIDHVLCTDQGVELIKPYINWVTVHGLIQYLFDEFAESSFLIMTIIYHTFQVLSRDAVMTILSHNHTVSKDH